MLFIGIIILLFNIYRILYKGKGYVHWKNGQDEVHIGHWENGIYEYKRALNYLPDNGELQFHLGAAYSYTGIYEKAIDLLTQSLEKFNDKNIYLTLGHAYRISGDYQKAEENFRTVIRMYPQLLLPHLWLAELYYESGEIDESIRELKIIIDAKPKIISQDVIFIKQDAKMLLQTIQSLRTNK